MSEKSVNILVVEDDPVVLEDLVLMYEEMIEWGDLADCLGHSAEVTVTAAENAHEAEKRLAEQLEVAPQKTQILHVDQRMPGENGTEFVDRMRYKHCNANMGAMLVTGYASDDSVQHSRSKGVYRYIPKPVTAESIKPHLHDLLDMILLKDKR